MRKTVIRLVAITAVLALLAGAAADTLVTQKLVVQLTSNLANATATSLNTPTIIVNGGGVLPTIKACNGGPGSTSGVQGSICLDSSTPAVWQNLDGATQWGVISNASTASISITTGTPGNIDLTATGTMDWMYTEAWGTNRAGWHSKVSGGMLINSFDFLTTAGASGTDNRSWTNFAAFSDDVNVNGIQSAGVGVAKTFNGYNGSNAVNTGWHFRLPSDGSSHTVSWQGTMFNTHTTVHAKLDCGLVSPQTLAINTIAGNGLDYRAIVTWTAPRGCQLVVWHQVDLCINGTSCNLYLGPIWAF